ncbi:Crp/Fnr family transcriptional regulator [Candidatus Curtissbacteria bacterium]|nr:Crp/Fnr family transcriptional regulator [Candidatus Curtissbacteria bacterium]
MNHSQYLKDIDVFEQLTKNELRNIHDARVCKNLAKGEIVSEPGQCDNKVYVVEQGQIRLYYLAQDGREQTLDILPRGAFFGDIALDSNIEAYCAFAAAEQTGTTVCILKKDDFFKLVSTRPKLALKIISDLAQRLSYAQEKISKLTLADAKARLISELFRLGKNFGTEDEKSIQLKRRFTHEQLANLIGTTRETVTKTIKAINDDCPGCIAQDKNHYLVINKHMVLEVISGAFP